MTVAFVLQGGGSLTAGQVGMLQALGEAGIRPDVIVGSSAGALSRRALGRHPGHAYQRGADGEPVHARLVALVGAVVSWTALRHDEPGSSKNRRLTLP
jgi:hypothetical protein